MRRSILAVAAATALASLAVAGTASAQTTIQPGRTVNGELTSRDARWDGDNTPMDCYVLQTTAGQSYVIDYRSDAFDAFLAVGRGRNCQGGNQTAFDDDSGGGLHSRLTLAGDGQAWFIRANAIAENSAGTYTLAVSGGGNAPSRPVGKPPAGGGSTPPANNNSGGGNAGSFAGLSRPTDPQERYTWDTMCSGVDTVALIISSEGMSDEALMAWVEESSVLHAAAVASGRAIGKTEEDVTNDSATFGAAYFQDETLFDDAPPVDLRNACLAVAPR